MTVVLAHLLKWRHQPGHRTGSWKATIITQRQKLVGQAASGVLRVHAEDVLSSAYADAVERAAAETGLSFDSFPKDCPYGVDQLLHDDLLGES